MMRFRQWLETDNHDWAITAEVPTKPGATPIPPNYVRLFHYTKVEGSGDDQKHQTAELLRKKGILISMSQGTNYGEPSVVWASRQTPMRQKVFVEFSMDAQDPRWGPYWRDGDIPRENGDCFFTDSIHPEELIAVHEPWHHRYRYMVESGLVEKAKSGEFDFLLSKPEYGPAVRKAKAS
jgi:hypothetical protein